MIKVYLACRSVLPKYVCFEIIIKAFPILCLYGSVLHRKHYVVKKICAADPKLIKNVKNYIGVSGDVELFNALFKKTDTITSYKKTLFLACENNHIDLVDAIFNKFGNTCEGGFINVLTHDAIILDRFDIFKRIQQVRCEEYRLCNFYFDDTSRILKRKDFIEYYGTTQSLHADLFSCEYEFIESSICQKNEYEIFRTQKLKKWGALNGSLKVIKYLCGFGISRFEIVDDMFCQLFSRKMHVTCSESSILQLHLTDMSVRKTLLPKQMFRVKHCPR